MALLDLLFVLWPYGGTPEHGSLPSHRNDVEQYIELPSLTLVRPTEERKGTQCQSTKGSSCSTYPVLASTKYQVKAS